MHVCGAERTRSARTARRRHRDVLLAEANRLPLDHDRLGAHTGCTQAKVSDNAQRVSGSSADSEEGRGGPRAHRDRMLYRDSRRAPQPGARQQRAASSAAGGGSAAGATSTVASEGTLRSMKDAANVAEKTPLKSAVVATRQRCKCAIKRGRRQHGLGQVSPSNAGRDGGRRVSGGYPSQASGAQASRWRHHTESRGDVDDTCAWARTRRTTRQEQPPSRL